MSLHLWKDGQSGDDQSVNTIPENGSFKSPGENFIVKKNPFSYVQNRIIIKDGCAFDIFDGIDWRQISNREDIDIDPASILDTGSALVPGTDYYLYICKETGNAAPELILSPNATYPAGFTAYSSRKIGGFHYGHIRIVDDTWTPIDSVGAKYGSGGTKWQDNVTIGIVPNSVWDLKNRPKVLLSGMVKVGGFWMSIYQASLKTPVTFMGGTSGLSISGGELQSKYGQLPATGTEGLCQYNFVELAARLGLRLPSYTEWLAAAIGNPQGEDNENHYGWTKTTNSARTRTGCAVNASTGVYDVSNGIKPSAISAYNCVDMIGNVWEWLTDYTIRQDTSPAAWAYQDVLGAGMGQAYLSNNVGLSAFIAGGFWGGGVGCGPRSVNLSNCPWNRHTFIGSRLACDAA